MPLDPRVSAVLSQPYVHAWQKTKFKQKLPANVDVEVVSQKKLLILQNILTNPRLVKPNREGPDQVFQEGPHQPEVDATDAPGAVHQDHDVGDRWSLATKSVFS